MRRTVDPHCAAYQQAVELLGRPWTALLLGLLQDGPLRFGELEERARGPGPKVLSARLKQLARRGVVERRVEPGPPIKVAYTLTRTGRAFGAVAAAIERWGRELVAGAPAAKRRR